MLHLVGCLYYYKNMYISLSCLLDQNTLQSAEQFFFFFGWEE